MIKNKPNVRAPTQEMIQKTLNIIQKYGVNTVCYSSKCPNIAECFKRGSATFMICGNICSRNCAFCNVTHSIPQPIDTNEGYNIANSVKDLDLKYVVITSVDRDDLDDFGSSHFYNVIQTISKINPNIKIEALTPDFQGDIDALNLIISSNAYKLAHNIETIQRLHKRLKPKSDYFRSLQILEYYARFKITKSSLIVGFGETKQELKDTMKDLFNSGVTQLTIGQYLQPSNKHYKVHKFYSKDEFEELKEIGLDIGFKAVESGELVRSSYYADKL